MGVVVGGVVMFFLGRVRFFMFFFIFDVIECLFIYVYLSWGCVEMKVKI